MTVAPAARPVLLALDGSRPANAALRLARRLTERGDWAPEAITVTEPLPVHVGDVLLPVPPMNQELVSSGILLGLKSQLRRHGLPGWRAAVRFGMTAPAIVDEARRMGARMIVMGLGKHGAVARLFGAETVARVVHHADVPVLAAHASTRGWPTIAVVATDFSPSAERAAREALALLQPPATLHLVHVMGRFNFTSIHDAAWEDAYADAVAQSFARVIARLDVPQGVSVATKMLHGQVVEHVIAYAKTVHADVVAAGRHQQGAVERVMLGSTPAQLLRAAPCAVLIAPPSGEKERAP